MRFDLEFIKKESIFARFTFTEVSLSISCLFMQPLVQRLFTYCLQHQVHSQSHLVIVGFKNVAIFY